MKCIGHRIAVRVHPGAESWAPAPAELADLACGIHRDALVEIVPRRDLEAAWQMSHPGTRPPARPYAFRAWTNGSHAVILVDATETRESVLWLLWHELAHQEIDVHLPLARALRAVPRPEGYLVDDDAHEAWPEERLANAVANQGRGRVLDRRWWRRRTLALG